MADGFDVKVYVYDLSQGLAAELSLPLLGKKIDGIWHTGIVVYGVEYFYGSMGISNCPPGQTILGQPTQIVPVGKTQIPQELCQEFLSGLGDSTFRGECYRLLEHNCNNFSNEVALFLTGSGIPPHITSLPGDVMATPFGAMIRPFIEGMSVQPANAVGRSNASLPSPYVAPVLSQNSPASSSTPRQAAHSSQPAFPTKTAGEASSSASSSSAQTAGSSRSVAVPTIKRLPLSAFAHACHGGPDSLENPWLAPFMLFEVEQSSTPELTSDPGPSPCKALALDLPRVVIAPNLEDVCCGLCDDQEQASQSAEISSHTRDCIELLKSLTKGLEERWLDKARKHQLLGGSGDHVFNRVAQFTATSETAGLHLVGCLVFALTAVVDRGSEQCVDVQHAVLSLLASLWPTAKAPAAECVRVAVVRLLLQLSVHDEWRHHLLSKREWRVHKGETVSSSQIFLPILHDGILDSSRHVRELAVSCMNNVSMQLSGDHAALECAASLAEYLQTAEGALQEVAFQSLFRCLALNEDEIGSLLAATGLSMESLEGISSEPLQPALDLVKGILLSCQ